MATPEENEILILGNTAEISGIKREMSFMSDQINELQNQNEQLLEMITILQQSLLEFDITDHLETGNGILLSNNGGKSIISSTNINPITTFYARQTGKKTVTILGGSVRFHGEKIGTVADTDLTLTGSVAYVYVEFVREDGGMSITFDAAVPEVDTAKIIYIPLYKFEAMGSEYKLTKSYKGDYNFDTPMAIA